MEYVITVFYDLDYYPNEHYMDTQTGETIDEVIEKLIESERKDYQDEDTLEEYTIDDWIATVSEIVITDLLENETFNVTDKQIWDAGFKVGGIQAPGDTKTTWYGDVDKAKFLEWLKDQRE